MRLYVYLMMPGALTSDYESKRLVLGDGKRFPGHPIRVHRRWHTITLSEESLADTRRQWKPKKGA